MNSPFLDLVKSIEESEHIERNPSPERLRELAKDDEHTTEFGSASYRTKTMSRSAKFTEIVFEPKDEHKLLLEEVKEYLNGKKLISIDRVMCQHKGYGIKIRSFVSEKYARILSMWGNTLFSPDPEEVKRPDFYIIDIPEWPEKKILVDPNNFITFILGSDYMGEMKKAGLRMGMYSHKVKHGGLGLHAGSKLLKVWNKEGKMVEKGMILFGLSATGKTTLTCHHHWLSISKGEEVRIRQDDVLMMNKDGSAAGTEENFYIKTDGLEPDSQPLLFKGATSPNAILENVFVDEQGKVDFFDSSITSNGRAVVMRRELDYSDDSIDLAKIDMVVFITRRKTIVPPIARLSPAQAAAFFMLGESVESSAGDPTRAGKPIKVVGTNPFIVGSEAEEGNRFLEILKANPGIECFLLDTGSFGQKQNTKGMKISVYNSARLLADAAREVIVWKKDPDWGYEVAVGAGDVDLGIFDPDLYYGNDEYKKLTKELKEERRAWLHKFEGLNKEIVEAI